MNIFTIMRNNIYTFCKIYSLFEFLYNLICLERNLPIQGVFLSVAFFFVFVEWSPTSSAQCLTLHELKACPDGFFCELFATCCRWTIDWLPCGLRVVFFVTYQGREYQGMHLGLWSMILVETLSYYISCFTSLCNKNVPLARTRNPPIWRRYHLETRTNYLRRSRTSCIS